MSAPPTRLPRVKICGLRRPEDASLALELGADLLGCVFADDSPRCATIAEATAIRALAGATPVVLVTRDVPSNVCEMCAERTFATETVSNLDAIVKAVQLPGVEAATVDYAKMVAHLTETGAIRVADEEPVAAMASA